MCVRRFSARKMRIKSINIDGFRGIPTLKLEFPEQVNVLVGVNGAGKSAVLDCTAIMLSRLIGRIRSTKGTGRIFSELDINNHVRETRSEITIQFRGESVCWQVIKPRRWHRRQRISGLEELRRHVEMIRLELEEDESSTIPLAVYYPVNRAVLDIPLRIRTRHRFDRLSAYDQALSGSPSSFRLFFEWFREREDLENEHRRDKSSHRDSQLQTVRTAIEHFLPSFGNLRVRRSPLRMVVDKDGENLVVNQLSDGEKCTLAMVGDLARRMAVANPDMTDPLQSEAIALIDEADLHLHPSWQRRLASAFAETFPNCQFLLSTHSPAILSHLKSDSIWILRRTGKGIEASRPANSYGHKVDRILEDIMEVPARPDEVSEKLSLLFLSIEQNELKKARRILDELKALMAADPDLVKTDLLIQRKETLGR